MDIEAELIIAGKLLLAMVLGCLVGLDREREQRNIGVRTFGGISLAACLFVAIAAHLTEDKSAIARMLSAIATGLGFIGAGLIFKDSESSPKGLTTAAGLWATAAVGAAVALNMFLLACIAALLIFILLGINRYKWYRDLISKISSKSTSRED